MNKQLRPHTEADKALDTFGVELFFSMFESICKMKDNRLYDIIEKIIITRDSLTCSMEDGSHLIFFQNADNSLKWDILVCPSKKDGKVASLFAIPPTR